MQRDDMSLLYDKLLQTQTLAIASPVYFYGISAQLKAAVDRLHTPLRGAFPLWRTALLLVGAAHRPDLFDAVLAQYRLILSYFGLEDAGCVLAPGCRAAGSIENGDALRQAFELGRRLAESAG